MSVYFAMVINATNQQKLILLMQKSDLDPNILAQNYDMSTNHSLMSLIQVRWLSSGPCFWGLFGFSLLVVDMKSII
jgi:hypothetical protein